MNDKMNDKAIKAIEYRIEMLKGLLSDVKVLNRVSQDTLNDWKSRIDELKTPLEYLKQ
jgi:hypothetical protein